MDAELAELLAELEPGRDGRTAFAVLYGRMWRFVDRETAPEPVCQLFSLAAAAGNGNRCLLVLLLAEVAQRDREMWHRSRPTALGMQLQAGLPLLASYIADADPLVRRVVPYAICEIGTDDAGVRGLIGDQATVEDDALALAGQVKALDELGPAAGTDSLTAAQFAPWLNHRSPSVRMAAVGAVARRGRSPGDGTGLGSVAVDALAAAGPRLWEGSPWQPPVVLVTVRWLAGRLADYPDEGDRVVRALFASEVEDLRRRAPSAAAAVLDRWRLPMRGLWDTVAAGLSDSCLGVRQDSAQVLASGGVAVQPYARELLDIAERDGGTTAIYAVAALAGLGDTRVLPALRHWISINSYWHHTIAVSDLLIPFRDEADQLLPAIRAALQSGSHDSGQYPIALAAWGSASADAVGELVGLLDTVHAARSCAALGSIGPKAAPAADALAQLASGRRRPPRIAGGQATIWPGTQAAAWAHWRVTGDAAVALTVLGQAVRRGPGQAMLPYLAQLGPLAAGQAADVRRLLDLPGGWNRVEAAYAWWRITGDPALATPVLVAALQPLRTRHSNALVRTAVRYLGAIGRPAEAALSLLEGALTGDRRHRDARSRRLILDDDALVAETRIACDRIGGRG